MSKNFTTCKTESNGPVRIEDLIINPDKSSNCKSNFNHSINLVDIPKNQKEFGHRKRIKP